MRKFLKLVRFGEQTAAWLGLVMVLVATAVPRLTYLDRFATPDEALWLARSANFYYALSHLDFAETYQKEHPGVTVMWAGAAGYLVRLPGYARSAPGYVDADGLDDYLRSISPQSALSVLEAGRFFLVLAQIVLLGLSNLYLQRLLGSLPALLGGLLIALDPFHIALNRLLHLDGLLSSLMLLSLLAFVYALRTKQNRHLVISGFAAGLSWLTKSPGLFLAPILVLLLLADQLPAWQRQSWQVRWQMLRSFGWRLLVWGMSAAILFILLWPAMWVAPLESLNGIFSQAIQYAESGHGSPVFYNGRIWQDGRITAPEFYLAAYLWRVTPFTLLGLVLAGWAMFERRSIFHQLQNRRLLYGLSLLVVVFTLVMTLGAKKFDRYLLPVFALLDILAALGYTALIRFVQKISPASRMANLITALICVLVISGQLTSAFGAAPYYLTYYNPLLGGAERAQQVLQIGWGEGLDQAGRYLDQKRNASRLVVSSWYALGPFSYYFSGKSELIIIDNAKAQDSLARLRSSDYAVIYIHQRQRDLPKVVLEYVSELKPEHTIRLNGIDYVWIYKIR